MWVLSRTTSLSQRVTRWEIVHRLKGQTVMWPPMEGWGVVVGMDHKASKCRQALITRMDDQATMDKASQ